MADIKYDAFEKKRLDKIAIVKNERSSIVHYADRKQMLGTTNGTLSPTNNTGTGKFRAAEETEGIGNYQSS